MPFTFSHPAAILPLTVLPKKWFSLTGLIIGSIVPDFEYFLRMKIKSEYSHTIYGLFWFDLPVAILIAFVFHVLVRNSFFHNLPGVLKSRLTCFTSFNWIEHFKSNTLIIIISVLTGAMTHILWDSFTHNSGYFVQMFSALRSSIYLPGFEIPVSKLLQHLSTLLGGIAVIVSAIKMPVHKYSPGKPCIVYWASVIMITAVIIAIRFRDGIDFTQYGNLLATAMAAVMLSLIITPAITSQTRKK